MRFENIYDFDPHLAKKAQPVTGKLDLESDASNLAIALNHVLRDSQNKRRFRNLVSDVLPFVGDVRVDHFVDRSLLIQLKETYSPAHLMPSPLVSDGTINTIALILALYFEDKSWIVIEEPERNIHPFLISRVITMAKDAAETRQVILTTHDREIVKHSGIDALILVSRNKEGFSRVSKPRDNDTISVFLKNKLGIEDLFVQNFLSL